MKLYDYFRSSASFRVRIALNLKDIPYTSIPIHLLKMGGEQRQATYLSVNPQGLVPALVLNDGSTLIQSLAIIEYLEEAYPKPPLLPKDLIQRAKIRAVANMVACDIHPINNLRVLQYLEGDLKITDEQKKAWYCHWIYKGFTAIETMLETDTDSTFCFGNTPTLADIALIPQVYNALRFRCEMTSFPFIDKIYHEAKNHPAFAAAFPEKQNDAE